MATYKDEQACLNRMLDECFATWSGSTNDETDEDEEDCVVEMEEDSKTEQKISDDERSKCRNELVTAATELASAYQCWKNTSSKLCWQRCGSCNFEYCRSPIRNIILLAQKSGPQKRSVSQELAKVGLLEGWLIWNRNIGL
ncbi:hypothetical protein FQA39_LY00192 [Lamprigera yunnana]|nr:hypothetical protein FQA39_LY00192 [Lamprigera yunnana]